MDRTNNTALELKLENISLKRSFRQPRLSQSNFKIA